MPDARGREFDRQRQAVEPLANPDHRGCVRLRDSEGRVDRIGPRRKETYSGGGRRDGGVNAVSGRDVEWGDREDPFAREAERVSGW